MSRDLALRIKSSEIIAGGRFVTTFYVQTPDDVELEQPFESLPVGVEAYNGGGGYRFLDKIGASLIAQVDSFERYSGVDVAALQRIERVAKCRQCSFRIDDELTPYVFERLLALYLLEGARKFGDAVLGRSEKIPWQPSRVTYSVDRKTPLHVDRMAEGFAVIVRLCTVARYSDRRDPPVSQIWTDGVAHSLRSGSMIAFDQKRPHATNSDLTGAFRRNIHVTYWRREGDESGTAPLAIVDHQTLLLEAEKSNV